MSAQVSKSILVTGANRGIGRHAVRELLRRGHRVVFTARDAAQGEAARVDLIRSAPGASVEMRPLDLASFASVRRFAAGLVGDGSQLDVIIHNAGTLVPPARRTITADGVEETLQVHVVGPYLLSTLLLPVLRRPARLVFIGSSLHLPDSRGVPVGFHSDDPFLDQGYHPERAYKNAKLAQLWLAAEWQRRYGAEGIPADVVCPGFVPATVAPNASGRTRLLLRWVLPWTPFATSPEEAGRIEADWAEQDAGSLGGRYYDGRQVTEPSPDARDPERARAFWALLEQWVAG